MAFSGEAENVPDVRLPDGHGSLSKAVIDKILLIMRDQGLIYYDAVKEAGFGEANLSRPKRSLTRQARVLRQGIVWACSKRSGKPEDPDEVRYGIINNPTVHIALNQVRQVVNELILLHGKPEEIVLEIARDLPMGADGKRGAAEVAERRV